MRLELRTNRRCELVDITKDIQKAIRDSGVGEGMAMVMCRHTTAGITINENADPDVAADLLTALDRMAPRDAGWRHREGNSDAHVKASLMGASASVPIVGGELALGTWQSVYFCEFDGPRSRTVEVIVMAR